MRVIKDIDLIKWNEKLQKTPYRVQVNSIWVNDSQLISFYSNTNLYNQFKNPLPITDPVVKWEFTFSVVESRKNEFSKILQRLLLRGISNYVDTYGNNSNNEKISIDNVVSSNIESSHEIFNRKYIKYVYNFNGRLSSILSYITIIEDAIEFFSKIWIYDENGEEHCLIKFPIGSVVSKEKDRSKDFLVLDYNYIIDYKDYVIDYVIVEIISDYNSLIISYGEPEVVTEFDITWSRDSRIDNILN